MKVKLIDLMQINQIFEKLYDKPLSVKTSYKLMKFAESTQKDIQFFKQNIADLIEKYGEKDKDGNLILVDDNYKIEKDHINDFNTQYKEIQEVEAEIKSFKLSLDELKGVKLTPAELYIIKAFIKT